MEISPNVMVGLGAALMILLLVLTVIVARQQALSTKAPAAPETVYLVPSAPADAKDEKKVDEDERKDLVVLGKRPFTAYGNDEGARTLRQTASSSFVDTTPAMAFPTAVPLSDRLKDAWESADAYDPETGFPTSDTATILVGGKALKGEWLQLEVPVQALVKNYTIHSQSEATGDLIGKRRAPRDWTLLGSKDGAAWSVLDSRQGGETGNKDYSIDQDKAEYYRFFRLVIERIGLKEDTADPIRTRARISDWVLRVPSYL